MNTNTDSKVDMKKPRKPSRVDDAAQYVHQVALNPKPEVRDPHHKGKDVKQRCIKFTFAAVISLLLLLLLVGILLAYYFSSSCVHGLQCGDGSCVWDSQWCDGVMDCPAGQDEDNCVRLHGSSFLLQIYSTQVKGWRKVCSQGWTDTQGAAGCHTIGYSRGTYFKSGRERKESDSGFLMVKSDFNPKVSILKQLVLRDTCPNNSVVTLRCTDCGNVVNSTRASEATVASWPWQVSLQVSGSHRCGGAIVSPHWIVTAAHCVTRVSDPGAWAVYAGIVDSLGSLFNPAHPVSRIITHEGYSSRTARNDIALMRLTNPLHFTGSGSLHLMEAQVSLTHSAECNSSNAYKGKISQDMFCATEFHPGAGSSMCHADGGSPLVTQSDKVWWLIGDSVWGQNCGGQNKPGVYNNVTHSLRWIYHQMKVKMSI
ncbi:transmembrane protease serine 2-like [Gouania willdenowi]|uniref:transmembrane protease serine 2-like n=1 Tax=Gouania willdenowi TaxID=441366 RepID=UPI001056B6B0|nr:transmembrane protease serine 2-like [Gouania willdenowi]